MVMSLALVVTEAGPVATAARVVEPPPARSPHQVSVTAGLPAAVTLTAFDPDGDARTFTVVDPPAHGTLSGTAPALTSTADPGYAGPDRLTCTAFDGELTSNLGVFGLTVVPAIVPTGILTRIPTEEPARSNAPPVIPDGTPVGAAR